MERKNMVSCYNKKDGLDYLVGYSVIIPRDMADKYDIFYDDDKHFFPTVNVERIRSDKVLPISIMHGQIQYATPTPKYFCTNSKGEVRQVTDADLCRYVQDWVSKYEAQYGEYHEENDKVELDLMVNFPEFGTSFDENTQEIESEDYEEELE